MYKWHVNSAIGRVRPHTNDFARVADGIAASLRQFSVSISRAEDEGEAPTPTRAQRGAEAVKEILPPIRGIDARSLAAKPPQSFTIRRVDETRPGSSPRGRGGFSGDRVGGGGFVSRGRGGTGTRARGGGRGTARGGRGRGRGDKKPRGPRPKRDDEDEVEEPLNDEELAWMAGNDGGWPTPYVPQTSLESLIGKGPSVISSSRGIVETAVYKMQVAYNHVNGPHVHADEHLARMKHGDGTLYESAEAKAIAEKFFKETSKSEFATLPAAEREKLAKFMIAGHYVGPTAAKKEDVLGQVEAYARRNETYLPEDSRKVQAKLQSLLPAVKSAPGPVKKPL